MGTTRHIAASAALLGGVALTSGDVGGLSSPLCCTSDEFQVGGTVDVALESGVVMQAIADVAGIGSAAVDDLTTVCRAIATDLGASKDERASIERMRDKRARMTAYCNLAVSAIGDVEAIADGSISVAMQPPRCSASVNAKTNCQARCSGSTECDLEVNPPICEGGSLTISCDGSCSADGGASVSCVGSCSGSCSGECTAEGGVDCAGKCEGTCMGGPGADGTCNGTCIGTCKSTAPNAMCTGSCNGSCTAACVAQGDVAVECDGSCDGDLEPLSCEGGKLEGGCEASAECEASCDASVQAKAKCTQPSVKVAISGAADIQAAGKLKAVLEANLGLVASLEARVTSAADVVATLAGSVDAEVLIEATGACIPIALAAVDNAVEDFQAAASASGSIIAAI